MIAHKGRLRGRNRHCAVGWRRPDEAGALQALGIERHADPGMPENLDQIAPSAPENMQIAGMRIAPGASCTCSAKPLMPLRMSVRPTASQTRTPEGTGIIESSPRQNAENPLQRRGVNIAIDANPSPAPQLDLDQPGSLPLPATRRLTAGNRLIFGHRRR
jgi:hypothetical protein